MSKIFGIAKKYFSQSQESFTAETAFVIDRKEAELARVFSQQTVIGGICDSEMHENAASYFSGYVGMKLNKFHEKLLKKSMTDCEECHTIFVMPDISLHFFTSFKEYRQNDDGHKLLKYCSNSFIETIMEMERFYLYCFSKYFHLNNFFESSSQFMFENCDMQLNFCQESVKMKLVKFFIRCRTFHSVKEWNNKLKCTAKSDEEKLKKMSNK